MVDATCAPSQITYPQDVSLLNQAREYSEKIIDEIHVKGEEKLHTYCKKAHKDYTSYARSCKPKAKQTRKAIGKQLGYLKRNTVTIERVIVCGKQLPQNISRSFQQSKQFAYSKKRCPTIIPTASRIELSV